MIYGRFLAVALQQGLSRQELGRVPEPHAISSGLEQALHYSRALETPMSLVYALALDILKGAWRDRAPRTALEICSGPGLFSSLLARHLAPESLLGIDLSDAMLEQARARFGRDSAGTRAEFLRLDALRAAEALTGRKFDLVLFMNGAHHLEGTEQVREVIRQACGLCADGGMIFVLDPIRPRSERVLRSYSETVHSRYLDPGLTEFHSDFVQSLHASYTVEEFGGIVPEGMGRRWFHWAPRLVPSTQILIGAPGGSRFSPRFGLTGEERHALLPRAHRGLYSLMKLDFRMGLLKELGGG